MQVIHVRYVEAGLAPALRDLDKSPSPHTQAPSSLIH